MIDKLDAAVGPIKARNRGLSAGQVLVGMFAAQLCGEDSLVGLDRHRADRAGQALTPVPRLASTTAVGLAAACPTRRVGGGRDRARRRARHRVRPARRVVAGRGPPTSPTLLNVTAPQAASDNAAWPCRRRPGDVEVLPARRWDRGPRPQRHALLRAARGAAADGRWFVA